MIAKRRETISFIPAARGARRAGLCTTWLLPAVLLASLSTTGMRAFADESLDRLVRLVGRDAGLCVEIPHLDETVAGFEQGEFFQRLQRSRIYADWQAGPEYRRAREVVGAIENFTGKSCRQFVHDMFGRAVVVAVYAEPGPKMSAIMLTETTSREILDTVIEGWNRAEAQQTDPIEFGGQTYYKRTCVAKPGQGPLTLFYCKLDRRLLLSDREDLIRRSLTLTHAEKSNESLFNHPAFQAARRSLQSGHAARAYVNPRAWDAVLGLAPPSPAGSAASAKSLSTHPSVVNRAFERAWQRCEWLGVGLQLDRGIVVEAIGHYSMEGMSERARGWIHSMSGPADFLRLVPHDALVVVAGRQAFGEVLRGLSRSAPAQGEDRSWDSLRQVSRGLLLGLDPFEDVLPALRENWGAYLVARREAKPAELPIDGLIAAELPKAGTVVRPRVSSTAPISEQAPPFRDALDNGLNIGFNMAAAYFNTRSTGNPAVVRTETTSGARTRWIESLGPYQPAYSLTSKFLVFATSPQAVRNFIAQERSPGTVAPTIASLARRYFPEENQLIYIDTAAIRRFLVEHGQELIQHATRVRPIGSVDAHEALSNFLDVASLFDVVFGAGRISEGSARVVVGGIIHPQAAANAASGSRPASEATAAPEKPARPE